MNEQLPIPLPTIAAPTLFDRAERIRDLFYVARGCFIEIGRELIAASTQIADNGEWKAWLKGEFDWPESTARAYIQIAKAFPSLAASEDSGAAMIDFNALRLLAAPGVSDEVREEAVERAQAGEHITKQEADDMVAAAKAEKQRELEAKIRAALDAYRSDEEGRTETAIKEATKELRSDRQTLRAKLKEIKDESARAAEDPELIAQFMARAIGVSKLTGQHYQLLAQILGRGIMIGSKTYAPISPEKIREAREQPEARGSSDGSLASAGWRAAGRDASGLLLSGAARTHTRKARRHCRVAGRMPPSARDL